MTAVELQCWCLFRQMGRKKEDPQLWSNEGFEFHCWVTISLPLCDWSVCWAWKRSFSFYKNQRRFYMCSITRIISEIAIISVMLSLLESKKMCIVYINIVASGYSLRENRRQTWFLILVTLVLNDLKTRQFQF